MNKFHLLLSSDEEGEEEEEDIGRNAPRFRREYAARKIQKHVRRFLYVCRRESTEQSEIELAARLQINSQATLKEDTIESSEETPKKHQEEYSPGHIIVEMGGEKPVFAATKAYMFNSAKFSQIQFFGRCFLCAYAGHSQRYCALKYCVACDQFGHSVVCCGKQNFQIQTHQRQSLQRFRRAVRK